MFGKQPMTLIVGALVLGLVVPVMAATSDQVNAQALQARVQSLESQIASMQKTQGDTWLNERRAQEVKGLIREVLADAETRASLLQDGVLAGHDGKHFFLRSADGNFLLNLSGQIQFRYVGDFQDNRAQGASGGEDQQGFQLRRAKVKLSGHAWDPNLGYVILLGTNRASSNTFTEEVYITYKVNDQVTVKGGVMKLPFLREEITSSTRLLAVERAGVTEFFTLDRSEQIQLVYNCEPGHAVIIAALSDGARGDAAGFTDFGADTAEIALTVRGDVTVAGSASQGKDYVAWDGEEMALLVGGAIHWELGDADAGGTADYFAWTVDGVFEQANLSIFVAVMGANIDGDNGVARSGQMYGALVQAGYLINAKLQPFVRYEWMDQGVNGLDEVHAITAGANYFIKGHNAKFTADVIYVFEGDVFGMAATNPFTAGPFSSGLGLQDATGDMDTNNVIVVRGQFQLLY